MFPRAAVLLPEVGEKVVPVVCGGAFKELIDLRIIVDGEDLLKEGEFVFCFGDLVASVGFLDSADPGFDVVLVKVWKVRLPESSDLRGLVGQCS